MKNSEMGQFLGGYRSGDQYEGGVGGLDGSSHDVPTYEQVQNFENREYKEAWYRAYLHATGGTTPSTEEAAAEEERARRAGADGRGNWAYRTPSALTPEQVYANGGFDYGLRKYDEMQQGQQQQQDVED